jgi:hypothetical protein
MLPRATSNMLTLKAFIALVLTWCLLALAAILAASTHRFERWYMYLVADQCPRRAGHSRCDSTRAVEGPCEAYL